MAKLIEEIEKMTVEDRKEELDYLSLLAEHMDDIKSFLDLLRSANESGILTLLKALFDHKGDAMNEVSGELGKSKNVKFVRNLMSIYTLLSNIDPDVVRPFMLNLSKAVDRSEDLKDKGPMGLMAMRSQMMDPDVAVGFRVLFEVAKGFTRPQEKKE